MTSAKPKKWMALQSLLLLSFSLFYTIAPAQQKVDIVLGHRIISGSVIDARTSQPVEGASVIVKGSGKGTETDGKGQFHLNVPAGSSVLVVSHTGFATQEIIADGMTVLVKLAARDAAMDDVVVIGYGAQKKATLTGAVEQITSKTFESRAVTNIGLALQGETPGLLVTRTSPRPGNEGLAFQIRGATSINGGAPLIIIDGVPALNYYSFQNMNGDDIESISILKDGSAAIYGSRAANGVILVTTKRGKGKTRVDYSNNLRFTTNGITAFSPSMQQYATMWIDANKEEAVPNWWGWVSQDNMQKMQQGIEGIYHTQYWGDIFIGNANRIAEMFARRYSQQHDLSISNRGETSGYRLSLGYADNKGNLATAYDGQRQYNARFNYDYKLSDKIKMETNFTLLDALTRTPSAGLDASLYGQEMPFFPAKNPFGEWYADYGTVGDRQPVAATSDGGRDNINSMTARLDMKGTYQITRDLSFEGLASLANERFNEDRWVKTVQTYDWFGNPASTTITATQQSTKNPGYSSSAYTSYYQYYSGLLRYDKTIHDDHNISVVAGINAEKFYSQTATASRVNFTDLGVYDLNAASATTQTNSGGKTQYGLYSYLARANYNYKEKYLAELLWRRDGNSKFAPGYKFKNFGAASVGWVFTKESFFQDLLPTMNFGKIRASYGSMGNDVGIGNFAYLSLINAGTAVLGLPASQQNAASLSNSGLVFSTNVWEKVEQKNLGIDMAFLRNRLTGTFDYFIKDNVGMLSSIIVPTVLGGTPPKTNSGHLNVKGWEAIIGWKDSKKDYSYNFSFNISNTRSLISNVQGYDNWTAGKNGIVNGRPINSWFVYPTEGYFKDQADVTAYYAKFGASPDLAALPSTNAAVALRPGDTKKLPGPGGAITSVGNANSALVYKGDGNAHFVFGFNMGGSWKGFDISAFFQGQFKQLIQRNGWMAYPFSALYTNQNPKFLGKTWTTDDPNAIYPRLTVNPTRAKWDYVNNDFMLQNSRYIRLKSLIIGYTIPQNLTRRAKLDRVRVYFSGNDLWEWTSIKDGFDPEMGETSQNVGYPFYRTWSFGVNVGL